MAMAEDVIIHGDFVQFNGRARCEGCQSKDLKCALQKTDDGCMACAGASTDCIFSRTVVISGPKSTFQWETLLKKDQKPPVTSMQTPAPSSIAATTTPKFDNVPNGLSRIQSATGVIQSAPFSPPSKQDRDSSPRRDPIRLDTPSDTEDSYLRSGVDPSRRQQLGEVLSLAEQAWEAQLAQNNARVEEWLDREPPTSPSTENSSDSPASRKKASAAASRVTEEIEGTDISSIDSDEIAPQRPILGKWRCDIGDCVPKGLSLKDLDNSSIWKEFNRKDSFRQHLRRMHAPPATAPSVEKEAFMAGLEVIMMRCWRPSESDRVSAESRPETPPATSTALSRRDSAIQPPTLEAHPWIDPLRVAAAGNAKSQPATSNEAIVRFAQRANASETASRFAAWGERDEGGFIDQRMHDNLSARSQNAFYHTNDLDTPMALNHSRGAPASSRLFPKDPSSIVHTRPRSSATDLATPESRDEDRSKLLFSQIPLLNPATKTQNSTGGSTFEKEQIQHRTSPKSKYVILNNFHNANPKPQPSTPIAITDIKDPTETLENDIRSNSPRIADFLLKRMTQEQLRRYKRLISFKVDHLKAVQGGRCPSGPLCLKGKNFDDRAENVKARGFKPVRSDRGDYSTEASEYSVDLKWLPSEYPMPPTQGLPSEFECPLCFQVKKCQKPSDWAKHVCEDLQPFICSFEQCTEPKSFKRKADWIRHENERHRQLERWVCNINDCSHICFRKDNFVQHLVREHKLPEPKPRLPHLRSTSIEGPDKEEDAVWRLVEESRQETPKSPKDEPCNFCGNVCSSWKKLSSHLAKHMEDIAFPIWKKVVQTDVTAQTNTSPTSAVTPLHERPIGGIYKCDDCDTTPEGFNSASVLRNHRESHHMPTSIKSSGPSPRQHTEPRQQPALKPATYTPWYPQHSASIDNAPNNSVIYQPSNPPRPVVGVSTPSIFSSSSKRYYCDVQSGCSIGTGFLTEEQLEKHRNTAHGVFSDKPYSCDIKGCTLDHGFATQTDLKRHQKGVHRIYDEGGSESTFYRCQGKDCKDADKTWPRRDNFRGHLSRKHPDEDIEELTERSTFRSRTGSARVVEQNPTPQPQQPADRLSIFSRVSKPSPVPEAVIR